MELQAYSNTPSGPLLVTCHFFQRATAILAGGWQSLSSLLPQSGTCFSGERTATPCLPAILYACERTGLTDRACRLSVLVQVGQICRATSSLRQMLRPQSANTACSYLSPSGISSDCFVHALVLMDHLPGQRTCRPMFLMSQICPTR
jgi:hypothetical protein